MYIKREWFNVEVVNDKILKYMLWNKRRMLKVLVDESKPQTYFAIDDRCNVQPFRLTTRRGHLEVMDCTTRAP